MRIERLNKGHALGGFDCGVKALNDWLVRHAYENDRRDISRTFLLIDDSEDVIGYYSLSMGGVSATNPPTKLGRSLPKYEIGMVLLGRLAIATESQGRKLGRDLLVDAIFHAAAAGEHAAARFIAVDPIDELARTFCAQFGFKDISGDDLWRMFLKIDDALEAFNDAEGSPPPDPQ